MLVMAGILVVCALLWIFLRPEKTPAKRIEKLWAKTGVEKPNVILITLDTTRADHLACHGYPDIKTPNLDSLAQKGILFEQAAASSSETLPSHCSIMTGMYPTYHGVRINGNNALSEEQTTIAEVLSAQGYQTGAFIGAFVLDGRWGLKQGFQHYDDPFGLEKRRHVNLGAMQRPGNQVMDAALAWLDGQRASPFFAWIHLYDPHAPYEPPEPYCSVYGPRGKAGLYDGEIAFMDEQIGRCVSWLEKNGLGKNTIMVLIGDHGEGLGSHGEETHGYFIYEYAVHIPFIVVMPFENMRGLRISSQVSVVDVFPTVLEMTKIEAPSKTHGESLLPLVFGPQKQEENHAYAESMSSNVLYGWSPLYSLRTVHYKYIDAPRGELYDLARDADEQINLYQQSSEVARRMKADLDRLMAETSRGAPLPQAADLDKDTVERLAALGYIGAPVSARKALGTAGPLADPKDKLALYSAINNVTEMVMKNQYAEAAAKLESTLREEPTIIQARWLLSICYVETGRREEAKTQLELVLEEDPENTQALISMANILVEENKEEDAIAVCLRTLAVDERNSQASKIIGEIYLGKLKYAEALPYLEKAVDIQPETTRSRINLAICLVELKQYDRAEPLLKKIIQESPMMRLANFNLGLVYEGQGKLEQARAAYGQEIANYPEESDARFNLSRVLFKLGDRGGSLEQMREVIKINPKLADGYLLLARGLLDEPVSLDEVRGLVEKGLSLAETSELKALGYFILAEIYKREHQPEKMNAALEKARSFRSREE